MKPSPTPTQPLQPRRSNASTEADSVAALRERCSQLQHENENLREETNRAAELEMLVTALQKENWRLRADNARLRGARTPVQDVITPSVDLDINEEDAHEEPDKENSSPLEEHAASKPPPPQQPEHERAFRVLSENPPIEDENEQNENDDEMRRVTIIRMTMTMRQITRMRM